MLLDSTNGFQLSETPAEPFDVFLGPHWLGRLMAGDRIFPLHALVAHEDRLREHPVALRPLRRGPAEALDISGFLDAYYGPDRLIERMRTMIRPGKWEVYAVRRTPNGIKATLGVVLPAGGEAPSFTVRCNGQPETRRLTYHDRIFDQGHWFMPEDRMLGLDVLIEPCEVTDWAVFSLDFGPAADPSLAAFRPLWKGIDPKLQEGLPDEARIHRVAGPAANKVSFLNGGRMAFERLCAIAADHGTELRRGGLRVLDWGVGCGRVARHFNQRTDARITGIDIDADNVGWCASNLKGEFFAVGLQPPTPLEPGNFDAIYACSVLSHLAEDDAHAWLAEIARLLAPHGIALLSFHGGSNAVAHMSRHPHRLETVLNDRLSDDQVSHDLDGFIPGQSYYRQVFGSDAWWREAFGRYFTIAAIEPGVVNGHQHVAVLRRKNGTAV